MELEKLFEQFTREKNYLVGVTPKTMAWYKDSWSAFKRMVGVPEVLDRFILNDFVVALRKAEVKPRTCNTYICGINSFLTWLWENQHISEKLRIKFLKVEQKVIQTYSDNQLKAFISWKPKNWNQWRLFAILNSVIDTGARIDEMLSLKRSHINFEQLLITVKGKGQKERVLPMSPELRKVLYRWMQKHNFEYAFPTHDGNKWSYRNSLRYLKVLGKRLGITGVRVSWHTFRHTFGYNYAKTIARVTGDARNGIFHLQRQLGHSSLATTRIYVEIQPGDLKDMHAQTSILSRLR